MRCVQTCGRWVSCLPLSAVCPQCRPSPAAAVCCEGATAWKPRGTTFKVSKTTPDCFEISPWRIACLSKSYHVLLVSKKSTKKSFSPSSVSLHSPSLSTSTGGTGMGMPLWRSPSWGMSGSTICNNKWCQLKLTELSLPSIERNEAFFFMSALRLCYSVYTIHCKIKYILTIAGYDGYPLHLAQTRSRGASSVSLSKDRSVDFPVNRICQYIQLISVPDNSWAQIENLMKLYCSWKL